MLLLLFGSDDVQNHNWTPSCRSTSGHQRWPTGCNCWLVCIRFYLLVREMHI